MIIGLRTEFIFIAMLKTASTSIEEVLRQHADIALIEARFGKHMTVTEILQNFCWLFERKAMKDFFIFGVIRDPIDYVLSLYNSHTSADFLHQPNLYTGNMCFDDFLDVWAANNFDQFIPQHERMLDQNGMIGANFIMTFDRLEEGLSIAADRLGLPCLKMLPKLNASPAGALSRSSLSQEQIRKVMDRFSTDVLFMKKYCNVILDSFNVLAVTNDDRE